MIKTNFYSSRALHFFAIFLLLLPASGVFSQESARSKSIYDLLQVLSKKHSFALIFEDVVRGDTVTTAVEDVKSEELEKMDLIDALTKITERSEFICKMPRQNVCLVQHKTIRFATTSPLAIKIAPFSFKGSFESFLEAMADRMPGNRPTRVLAVGWERQEFLINLHTDHVVELREVFILLATKYGVAAHLNYITVDLIIQNVANKKEPIKEPVRMIWMFSRQADN